MKIMGFMRTLTLNRKRLIFWILVIVVGTAVMAPLSLLVLNSFRKVDVGDLNFGFNKFTLRNYVEAYSHPMTYKMLLNSFVFAISSMLVATFFGGFLAFLSERTNLRYRTVIPFLVMVPLIMPGVVKGIAWIFLLSPNIGLLNVAWKALGFKKHLFDVYSLPAMIWVEGISMSTLAFLMIGATLRQMDPVLEEAAFGSGASAGQVLVRVTLPLMIPGLAGVAILLFIRGIETFEVPMLLGLNSGIFVFSTNIYYSLRSAFPPDYGLGFAYSMMLITLTMFALVIYQKMFKSSGKYTVVTGKGYRPRVIHLGAWRYPAWGFVAFYIIFAIILPLLILVWASLLPYYKPPSAASMALVTMENYKQLLSSENLLPVLKNTIILGGLSGITIMFLAVLSSWFVHRTNIAGRKILDFIIFLPYAIGGMAIGVSFMVVFLSFPNPIYNTIWIIVLAYIVTYLPIGTRFTNASIVQVHKELEEAASASGANFWQALFYIWIPLLLPGLVNGILFVFILSLKVMSVAALLQSSDNMVLSVWLWHMWDAGDPGVASALAVLMIVVLGTLTIVARRLSHSSEAFKE
ncbi:MAG: iron ABC transporter permease [Desulfobacterales bacterium]|nr:iron ABC transporter permease [Desulfobacterales bacterium]